MQHLHCQIIPDSPRVVATQWVSNTNITDTSTTPNQFKSRYLIKHYGELHLYLRSGVSDTRTAILS